jgi:hypothetical protein
LDHEANDAGDVKVRALPKTTGRAIFLAKMNPWFCGCAVRVDCASLPQVRAASAICSDRKIWIWGRLFKQAHRHLAAMGLKSPEGTLVDAVRANDGLSAPFLGLRLIKSRSCPHPIVAPICSGLVRLAQAIAGRPDFLL